MLTAIFKKYEENTLRSLKLSYSTLALCELGNQIYAGAPAKHMYVKKGVQHTSIDINGLGGALPLDLDFPLPKKLENKFDVLTNYGTIEHVTNQYSVFRNVHVVGKVGCVMIHGVPLIGHWPKHCRYYYSKQFFKQLAAACNYTIIDLRICNTSFYSGRKNLVACVLRKKKVGPFISSETFYQLPGRQDTKRTAKTGNYKAQNK